MSKRRVPLGRVFGKRLPVALLLAWLLPCAPALALPAFPGAVGFGKEAVGGRGGRVVEVTNLNDSGPGSLREALEQSGPRTVVFKVGGTIAVDSPLKIANPYVTVAGQTAPGGGITIRNRGNDGNALKISTHDVIVRYLTVRPGYHADDSGNIDAIGISGSSGDARDIIIDHVSLSWATDETFSTWYAVNDVTLMESIVSEALSYSTHPEGEHGTGVLLGSDGAGNITLHRNLLAHNRHRNPRISTSGLVNVTNNVVYNSAGGTGWNTPLRVTGERGGAQANIVGNVWKAGPDSLPALHFVTVKDPVESLRIHARDNVVPNDVFHPDALPYVASTAIAPAPAGVAPADTLLDDVLAGVGNSLMLDQDGNLVDRRDAIDRRVVEEVRNGTGYIIDSPEQVGGWIDVANGTAYADGDGDGMPDRWEKRHGLDPNDGADRNGDPDGDGYTNLEEFLNGTEPVGTCAGPRRGRTCGTAR